MNKIIMRIVMSACCLYVSTINAKIQFKCTVNVTAYKADLETHAQTWSLQTTNSPKRGTPKETIFSSSTIKASKKGILLSTTYPTYVFVYKNDKAAGVPIRSIIMPATIRAVGNNPIMIIKADGSVTLEARKKRI
jgi:hypothetical protein